MPNPCNKCLSKMRSTVNFMNIASRSSCKVVILLFVSLLTLPSGNYAAALVRGGRLQPCPSTKSRQNFQSLFEEVFFSNENVPALLDYLPQLYTTGTILVVITCLVMTYHPSAMLVFQVEQRHPGSEVVRIQQQLFASVSGRVQYNE